MPHCRDLPSLRFARLGPRTQLPSFARIAQLTGDRLFRSADAELGRASVANQQSDVLQKP